MDQMQRLRELTNQINQHNRQYYLEDDPSISDKEYDDLLDELKDLEARLGVTLPDSPTQQVGTAVSEEFVRHEHLAPLFSLDKSRSKGDLVKWDQRNRRILGLSDQEPLDYVVELKFDGLTINLTYEEGKLIQAATRGNGLVGEAILAQVKTIKTIPQEVAYLGRFEIQGEGIMPLSALEHYNHTHEIPLKNARNAAAGALRNLNPKITASRNLDAYFYQINYIEGEDFTTHDKMLDFIRKQEFKTFPYERHCNQISEVMASIEEIEELRNHLDFLTDGAVIKVNDYTLRERLGYTARFPRWAMAYKFAAQEMTTILNEVVWNVGRTGKLTPVALLEPVDFEGVTVARATLNNEEDIERKALALNARVIIRRSNDVIPEILGVSSEKRPTEPIITPSHCPACDTELVKRGVHIFCPNSLSCKPQLISRLVHFASRDAMDIEGLSDKTAEKLVKELKIRDLPDLYELTRDDLGKIEGFKDKRISNMLEQIEQSKHVPLHRYIYGLGIEGVGVKTARDLAETFGSLEALKDAGIEELKETKDIGPITASSIYSFFHDEHILKGLEKLDREGVHPEEMKEEKKKDTVFTGKRVVITGSFQGYSRKEMEEKVIEMGGHPTSSVSSQTDYVIVGERAGSKFSRALELGVETIDSTGWHELIMKGENNRE